MDFATILGIFGGVVAIVSAMYLGGNLMAFVNIPSVLLVVLGSMFVVTIKFSLHQIFQAFKIAFLAFMKPKIDEDHLIEELYKLAMIAHRKGGPLALEQIEVSNPFLAKGVQMVVDGAEVELVRHRMGIARKAASARHNEGQRIFRAFADVAPGMGMIGTLIGLVQMLVAMDSPESIGPAMAVALLTTLYGSVIANVICTPIADKLQMLHAGEDRQKAMIIDTLCDIHKRVNPRTILESLENYLPTKHKKIETETIDKQAS